MKSTQRQKKVVTDDDGVFDDAEAVIALARKSFSKAAKTEVAKNDQLGIPTHGAVRGKLVVRHSTPPGTDSTPS